MMLLTQRRVQGWAVTMRELPLRVLNSQARCQIWTRSTSVHTSATITAATATEEAAAAVAAVEHEVDAEQDEVQRHVADDFVTPAASASTLLQL